MSMAASPSWGLLVHAPLETVRRVLLPFLAIDYDIARISLADRGDWTAVFSVEQRDPTSVVAAEHLRKMGFDSYHLEFSKHSPCIWAWDGDGWEPQPIDPYALASSYGFSVPGLPAVEHARSDNERVAIVVQGLTAQEASALVRNPPAFRDGPRGAVASDVSVNMAFDVSEATDHAVIHLRYVPARDLFEITVTRRGEAATDVTLDFTDRRALLRDLGVPESFLNAMA